MLTIHVWPKWLKEFLLTHPLYKSPKFVLSWAARTKCRDVAAPTYSHKWK